jgi:hypothetical protein
MNVIGKITGPNGKIDVGGERTDGINDFGSPAVHLITKDFKKAKGRGSPARERFSGSQRRHL